MNLGNQIVRLTAENMKPKEIATKLSIAVGTVYKHLKLDRIATTGETGLTPEAEKWLLQNVNKSSEELARELDCSISAIYCFYKILGIGKQNIPSSIQREMVDLHHTGMKQCDIARKLSVSRQRVHYAIKKYGHLLPVSLNMNCEHTETGMSSLELQIVKLADEGMEVTKICQSLGVSERAVNIVLLSNVGESGALSR